MVRPGLAMYIIRCPGRRLSLFGRDSEAEAANKVPVTATQRPSLRVGAGFWLALRDETSLVPSWRAKRRNLGAAGRQLGPLAPLVLRLLVARVIETVVFF